MSDSTIMHLFGIPMIFILGFVMGGLFVFFTLPPKSSQDKPDDKKEG